MTEKTSTEPEPSSQRLIMTLAIAGLVSGFVIVSIYILTLETINSNQTKALQAAVFKVLPGVERMQKLRYTDNALQPAPLQAEDGEFIYAGYDAAEGFVGYAIPGEGPGYQDTIRLLYGYRPEREVIVGMEILESRETPGLGDKIFKDQAFVANFQKLAISPRIETVKKGEKSRPHQVDAITGATISSKAVVQILNTANDYWLNRLPKPGAEPPLTPME